LPTSSTVGKDHQYRKLWANNRENRWLLRANVREQSNYIDLQHILGIRPNFIAQDKVSDTWEIHSISLVL
jgi:hypothetical protein